MYVMPGAEYMNVFCTDVHTMFFAQGCIHFTYTLLFVHLVDRLFFWGMLNKKHPESFIWQRKIAEFNLVLWRVAFHHLKSLPGNEIQQPNNYKKVFECV